MNILFLSQLLPYPANAGPKIRSYFTLKALVQAGHKVTLLAFARPDDRPEGIDHLRSLGVAVVTVPIHRSRIKDIGFLIGSLIGRTPFLITRDRVGAMFERLKTLVNDHPFDAIHVDQLWMAQYGLAAQKASQRPLQLVLDQHNAVFLIPERLAQTNRNPVVRLLLKREARVLKQYEQRICAAFDDVVWVTAEDRQALTGQDGARVTDDKVIPICVDIGQKNVVTRQPGARRVVFLGGLHWPPNAAGVVWFIDEVWPQVVAAVPEACLTIIGKDPPAGVESAPEKRIEVTGFVPEVAPYLREAAAFIVPLHAGGGMRVKIIDAWAWGLPIVSTTIGAEGTRYRNQDNILIGDDAPSFAREVIRLLKEQETGAAIGRSGRATAESTYDWRLTYQKWNEIYEPTS